MGSKVEQTTNDRRDVGDRTQFAKRPVRDRQISTATTTDVNFNMLIAIAHLDAKADRGDVVIDDPPRVQALPHCGGKLGVATAGVDDLLCPPPQQPSRRIEAMVEIYDAEVFVACQYKTGTITALHAERFRVAAPCAGVSRAGVPGGSRHVTYFRRYLIAFRKLVLPGQPARFLPQDFK